MLKIVGITHEGQMEKDIHIDKFQRSKYKWFWADFYQPSEEEIGHLLDTFHFHPLAIEDCTQRIERPKLDYYDSYTFYVTHIMEEKEEELEKEEINFFVGEHFIVTFHFSPSKEINQVWNRLLNDTSLEKWDPYFLFYQILDKIVDNYFPFIYKIEDELDKMEDHTYRKNMNVLMDELFTTRYKLLHLRHTINPMRDLLYRMLNSHHLDGIHARREYFSDIYDHLLKLSEMVMSNREVTADIRDSYLSLNAHQTNNVMKVLTIITSIFAPLTFIAGIYGMNFENIPGLKWEYGYVGALVIMLSIGVFMFLWFKKRGWF